MGNTYNSFLILFLIILGQSCVLLLVLLKMKQRMCDLIEKNAGPWYSLEKKIL